MASAGTSTSVFTRYSNGSSRSVSTAATSLSSGSWRSNQTNQSGKKYTYDNRPSGLPANVKFVPGTPWELSEMPRQLHQDPETFKYSAPPTRKRRGAKGPDSTLDTISERPQQKLPSRVDATTSTTDLSRAQRERDGERDGSGEGDVDGTPRKVQKGQINALAKMLSALRR